MISRALPLLLWLFANAAFGQTLPAPDEPTVYFWPAADSVNAAIDDYPASNRTHKNYRSWADLAARSQRTTGPIALVLPLGPVAHKLSQQPDWQQLRQVRHVQQVTLQLALPLTQALADSLLTALSTWPELTYLTLEEADSDVPTPTKPLPPIDGRLSTRLTALRSLSVYLPSGSVANGVRLFAHCPSVHYLNVGGVGSKTPTDLPIDLTGFEQLQSLAVDYTGDGPPLTDLLRHCPNLTSLTLQLRAVPTRNDLPLGAFPRLKQLTCNCSGAVTIDSLLLRLPIEELNISRCRLASLDWLANQPTLRKLTLEGDSIGYRSTQSLGTVAQLTSLSIRMARTMRQVPAVLMMLPNLHELQIEGASLLTLPATIGTLTSLTTLSLPNNSLRHVPASLAKLTQLRHLDLSGNALTYLPSVGAMRQLNHLIINDNDLSSLPEGLANCRQLTQLIADGNPIATLPARLDQLDQLEVVRMHNARLKSLPPSVGKLTRLRQLHLTGNRLTTLPDALSHCTQLTELSVGGGRLARLPGHIGMLTKLTRLELYAPAARALPTGLLSLTNLTVLNLYDSQTEQLPAELGRLKKLTELVVRSPRLRRLPNSLGRLTNLRILRVGQAYSRNPRRYTGQLTKLPDSLRFCTDLEEVAIYNQQAFDGAGAINIVGQLPHLREITLANCGITSLAGVGWGTLVVRNIRLAGNRLSTIPDSVLRIPTPFSLELRDNPTLPPGLQQTFFEKSELRLALLTSHPLAESGPNEGLMWSLLNSGRNRMVKKDWRGALADMNRAIAVAPDSLRATAWLNRGELHMQTKNYALAATAFRKAIAAGPRPGYRPFGLGLYEGLQTATLVRAQYWSRLAAAYDSLGHHQQAVAALDTAIRGLTAADEQGVKAYFYVRQAVGYGHWRKPAEARRCLLAAHALYAARWQDPMTRVQEVELAILSNRPDKARASLARLKEEMYTGGNTGAPVHHAFLTACTDVLAGVKTLPQARTALRTYLEQANGYFYVSDSAPLQILLSYVGLPANTQTAIRSLLALAKQYTCNAH
jgi:leucine-rich repeat protein SHOC2